MIESEWLRHARQHLPDLFPNLLHQDRHLLGPGLAPPLPAG
ncbi:hypothetical protein ACQ3I4_13265 [Zafaria sp. Z1313]|nr:hypothetical protein [Zafaria sp. J156]MEE1621431.1 hypothetical protein [Zafaria sp. J156]